MYLFVVIRELLTMMCILYYHIISYSCSLRQPHCPCKWWGGPEWNYIWLRGSVPVQGRINSEWRENTHVSGKWRMVWKCAHMWRYKLPALSSVSLPHSCIFDLWLERVKRASLRSTIRECRRETGDKTNKLLVHAFALVVLNSTCSTFKGYNGMKNLMNSKPKVTIV